MSKAAEVIGALATYRGDGLCPVCDGKVIEAIDRSAWPASPRRNICTVCTWSAPRLTLLRDPVAVNVARLGDSYVPYAY